MSRQTRKRGRKTKNAIQATRELQMDAPPLG
jgi:hypothetical protein